MLHVSRAVRLRAAFAAIVASTAATLTSPAAAQWVCEEPGFPVNCNDGWCCPGGASCLGDGRCTDGSGSTGNGGTTGGGTCPASHPVRCEAVGVCCGEGSTCGEEGCCLDVDVQGCTHSRVCSGEPDSYVVADGARFECAGDDCSGVERKLAEYCYENVEDDDGCAVSGAPKDGGAPLEWLFAATVGAAAVVRSRRRPRRRPR